MRVALVADCVLWGYLVLLRPVEMPDCSAVEVAHVSAVTPHLAEALRTTQLAAALGAQPRHGTPGLLLLGADDEVQAATRDAEELLEELGQGWRDDRWLRGAMYVVAAAARAAAQGTLEAGMLPRGRVGTPSGQWMVLNGSVLNSSRGAASQVAISIELAEPSDVAPLLVRAYEFTEREREVVLLVLRGLPTNEIAQELCISPYTVQDHLKAIFDKARVRGRRELVAEIFYRQHLA